MKKSILLLLTLAASAAFAADAEVYTWRNGGVGTYSDVPRNLQTGGVGVVNIRTHSVTQLEQKTAGGETMLSEEEKAQSLAERQVKLNQEIAEQNKRVEEENKRRAEESKKANCQTAKMNLQNAQSANRMANREEALARYQADIDKYCN